ncbi:uncharacterized protein LOC110709365 [Chenopodium quinoa]|uniref:uncharacterized protein LOC110709365 n=1 Tax=Chenopodium quinoa TaxID=63459 RepID=UPI000B76F8A3|nr:uncharacterized protein LOC110709365 [Chenopodium quinoa]
MPDDFSHHSLSQHTNTAISSGSQAVRTPTPIPVFHAPIPIPAQSLQYQPQAFNGLMQPNPQAYGQYGPYGQVYGQAPYLAGPSVQPQPIDWQMRLLTLGDKPPPFSQDILNAPQPPKVKSVLVGAYDGTGNPEEHITSHRNLMYLQSIDDATWCKCFPATLKGVAQDWFNSLPAGCINCFTTLSFLFVGNFSYNIPPRKTSLNLATIVLEKNEGLRSYVQRFNQEKAQIHNLPDEMAYSEFLRGLRHNGLKLNLVRKKIRTYAGVLREAEAYTEAADFCSLTKTEAPAKGVEKKSSQQDSAGQKKEGKKRKEVWVADGQPQKSKKVKAYEPQFEFNKDCYSILMGIKDKFEFEKTQPLRGRAQYRKKNKYYHYHKDVGHDTNDYINLKRLLDKLAEKGMLNSYVMKSKFTYTRTNNTSEQRQKNDKNKDKDDGNNTDSGFVAAISGGFSSGGPTMKGIKQDARNLGKVMQMDSVKVEPFPEVIISEADRGEVKALYNDPMVFIMKIANLKVGRILIDTGSAADIISLAALKNLIFPEDALQDITHPLVGFGGNVIHLVGRIDLPV